MRILGTVSWSGGEHPAAEGLLAQPRRLALLAYLAAARPRGAHRRDRLVAMFWPELDQEHARAALRQALFAIRSALGPAAVAARGTEELALDENVVWCDAPAFDRACDAGTWMEALDLYRGDLLDGFFISEAPEFDRWLDEERQRLRGRAAQAARALATRSESAGDMAAAVEWTRRALRHAPNDEPLFRELLDRLDRLGDRAGAARAYDAFAARLQQDLEVEPAAETKALIAAIRSRAAARDLPPPAPAARPTAAAAAPTGPAANPVSRAGAGPEPADARAARGRLARRAAVAAAAVVLLGLGVGLVAARGRAPRLAAHRVLVAPLVNRSGDSALDIVGDLAADWTARGLIDAGLVDVADRGAWLRVGSEAAGRASAARPTPPAGPETARSLAASTGSDIVVWGAVDGRGDSLSFEAFVSDVRTGRLLRSVRPVVGSARDVRPAVRALRSRIIGSLATVLDPQLASWTASSSQPPSFEAYEAFSTGVQLWLEKLDAAGALAAFTRSARLDSAFTLPAVFEAWVFRARGRCAAVDSIASRLEAPGRDPSRVERLQLEREVAWCRDDAETVYRTSKQLAVILRGSELMALELAHAAVDLGRDREAVELLTPLHPDRGELEGMTPYFLLLTQAYHALGKHGEELAAAERGRRLYPGMPTTRMELIALASLGRAHDIDARIAEIGALPAHSIRSPGPALCEAGLELIAHGHPEAAGPVFARALAWYAGRPPAEQADTAFRFSLAVLLDVAGRRDSAVAVVRGLVRGGWANAYTTGLLGVLAAERGDSTDALRADRDLASHAPAAHRWVWSMWRARIAALLGDTERAMSLVSDAVTEGMPKALPTGRLPLQAPYGSFLHTDLPLRRLWNDPRFVHIDRPLD